MGLILMLKGFKMNQINQSDIEKFLESNGNYIKKEEIYHLLMNVLPKLNDLEKLCTTQKETILELEDILSTKGKFKYIQAMG